MIFQKKKEFQNKKLNFPQTYMRTEREQKSVGVDCLLGVDACAEDIHTSQVR